MLQFCVDVRKEAIYSAIGLWPNLLVIKERKIEYLYLATIFCQTPWEFFLSLVLYMVTHSNILFSNELSESVFIP